MSAIDPTQGSRAPIAQPLDTAELDGVSLLMMLSWKQLDTLHGSLLASVNSTENDFNTLGKVGELKADLAKMKSTVMSQEIDNTEKLIGRAEKFNNRVNDAGSDPIVLSEADQNDLRKAEEWAKERGFVGPPLMLEQPVPKSQKTESDKVGAKGDGPPETQTVLNQAAYLEFRDALRGYLSELKAGTADNPALRSQFQNAPEYDQLVAGMKSLGLSTQPDSPQRIDQTLKDLGQLTEQIITRLEAQATNLRKMVGEVEASSKSLGELNEEQRRLDKTAVDRKVDAELSSLLEQLDAAQRTRMDAVLDALRDAQAAIELSANAVPDKVDWPPVDTRLSDELQAQFEKWQASLQSLLEPPPSPPQFEHRSIRTGKQFV